MSRKELILPLLLPISSGALLTEYQSNRSASFRSYPQFDGTRFKNPFSTWLRPSWKKILTWILCPCLRDESTSFSTPLPTREVLDAELPVKRVDFRGKSPSSALELTWLGHSSLLLRMDGISIITDPVFNEYCSPYRMESLRRFRDPPCSVEELPEDLALVVISHNHYDHLDYQSIVGIHRRYGNLVTFCVPKGLAAWFRSNISGIRPGNVIELSWWQSANFELSGKSDQAFQVVSVPAQHLSMRHPFNSNKTLWCGWVVVGPSGRTFYYSGDTGYCCAFKEIGAEFGPIDLAAITIGAYEPAEFLTWEHVNPKEAIEAHLEVRSKQSVGIHWGTFQLGSEGTFTPRTELARELAERNLPPKSFITLYHGETLVV